MNNDKTPTTAPDAGGAMSDQPVTPLSDARLGEIRAAAMSYVDPPESDVVDDKMALLAEVDRLKTLAHQTAQHLSDEMRAHRQAKAERDAALARLVPAEAIARAAVEWRTVTDSANEADDAGKSDAQQVEWFKDYLRRSKGSERALHVAINTHRSALPAPVAAPEMKALILPADRYLKSRAVGDWTYSSHSEGYSAALSDVADRLKAAGIPFTQEPDPVGETPEP